MVKALPLSCFFSNRLRNFCPSGLSRRNKTAASEKAHKETSVGLPALAGRGKELTSEGSMPDGVTIIYKLDEPSMGESSFKGRLPPLGGSPVTAFLLYHILSVKTVSVLSVPGRHHQRNGGSMSQKDEQDTMREEYDFSGGVRGKHYEAYRQGTNLVLLEPDVAKIFKDSATVNSALRMLAKIAQEYVPTQAKG